MEGGFLPGLTCWWGFFFFFFFTPVAHRRLKFKKATCTGYSML
jgi:hypothetical protein